MNLTQATSLERSLYLTSIDTIDRIEFFKTFEYYRREEIVLKRFKEETFSLRLVDSSLRDSCYRVSGLRKREQRKQIITK